MRLFENKKKQQHAQVTEMIREGLQRGLEIHTQEVTAVQTQLATAGNVRG